MSIVAIALGASISAAIAANPAGTTFTLAAGTYSGQQFEPKAGDVFIGASNGTTILNGNGLTTWMTYNNSASNVVFENLTLTNWQTGPQVAPIQTGTGWQLLNVWSVYNGGAGVYVGSPNTVIVGGSYSFNGQVGIEGSYANGSTIVGAIVQGNNTANYQTGWDAGGIKITNTNGLTLSNNTVSHNNGQGIWADISSANWTVTGNTVNDNSGNGIMYEISHAAATISGNTVMNNAGSQIYISNSDGVTASGNTVRVNNYTVFGSAGYGEGGGIDIINNTGRGNDPVTGQPYASINDTVTGNTIIQSNTSAQNGYWNALVSPNTNLVYNNNVYYIPSSSGTFWSFFGPTYNATNVGTSGYETSATFHEASIYVPTEATASPSGTTLSYPTSTSNNGGELSITDAAGNHWSLVNSGGSKGVQITVNGTVDSVTGNVAVLQYIDGQILQENTSGLWFTEAAPNSTWSNIPAPAINVVWP